ncbi:MAG: hypothetical protein ACOX6P_01410 [Candidatus Merdivicinus sp.]
MKYWQKYAVNIAEELPNKIKNDISGYPFEEKVLPIVQDVYTNWDKLELAHSSFQSAVSKISEQLTRKFHTDLDICTVFYLGLCSGAGWATELNGKPAILLGVEKILELKWYDYDRMFALIAHEIGHIWHQAMGGAFGQANTVDERAVFQLFSEGVAIWFEQSLYGQNDFYLENHDGWLDWCIAHHTEIKREYWRRIQQKESIQDFFGDWERYQGYSDVGYYLGTQFFRWLIKKYSVEEAVCLPIFKIKQEYQIFSES